MKTSVAHSGIVLGESPRWHAGRLWLSDWGAGQILSFEPGGGATVVHEGLGMPFSFDWTPAGRMVVIAGAAKALLREGSDGQLAPLVDLAPLCDRPWNEVVVDAAGNAYVNSIGFDMMAGEAVSTGVIALVRPGAQAKIVADGLEFPNGMAISPDGGTLVVAESYGRRLRAFGIAAGGELTGSRVWADLAGDAPDGICFDAEGAVWYASVPGRWCRRVREGGQVLETVETDRGCFACILGGEDGRTLFIAAANWAGPASVGAGWPSGQVLSTRVNAPHAGRP